MIARLKLWAAAAGVVIAALVASWLGGRKAGRTDIKIEGLKDEVKGHTLRKEIDSSVARDGDARERLRSDWKR